MLEYGDPEPLDAGYVWLGTHNNGISIPRVTTYGRHEWCAPVRGAAPATGTTSVASHFLFPGVRCCLKTLLPRSGGALHPHHRGFRGSRKGLGYQQPFCRTRHTQLPKV